MSVFGLVLLLLLLQDIALGGDLGETVSLDKLRALCVQETSFDFCGLSSEANTNAVGFSERDLRARLSAGVSHYGFRQEFQGLMEALDCSAGGNDRKKFLCVAAQICAMLELLQEKAQTENGMWLLLYKCMERVAYEIARVSESGFRLDPGDLDLLLPERLFVPPTKNIHRGTYYLLRGFRKLLVVGLAVQQYRIDHGAFPVKIKEMSLPDDLLRLENGMRLHYRTDGMAWHLWYGGPRCGERDMMFNVFIPTLKVDELSKWPFGGCPNYSSDYSRKRVHAYRDGGVLNGKSDLWRCELVNGKFRRKQ